jgi:predicted alpha/beta-hydrolase family hydrolase
VGSGSLRSGRATSARRARQAARKPSPEEKAAERAGREAIAQLRGLAKRRKLGAIEIAREGDRIVLSLTLEQVARLTT